MIKKRILGGLWLAAAAAFLYLMWSSGIGEIRQAIAVILLAEVFTLVIRITDFYDPTYNCGQLFAKKI